MCNHIIGLWEGYNTAFNVTLDELLRFMSKTQLKKYLDKRCARELVRYNYCPFCGEKIDWDKMKEENT